MLYFKDFLNICIICVHKAHLREKMGFFTSFFFSWNFWNVCLLDVNHVNWVQNFQASFHNPRDLPKKFLDIFGKIKQPSWNFVGGTVLDPQKTGFFEITSTMLLQQGWKIFGCYFNTVKNFCISQIFHILILNTFFGDLQKKLPPPPNFGLRH